jgi:hypothetical protein
MLNMLYNSIQNLQPTTVNPPTHSKPQAPNNTTISHNLGRPNHLTNCLLPTPAAYDPHWYRTTKPPEIIECRAPTTAQRPPIISLIPHHPHTRAHAPTETFTPTPVTYANTLRTRPHLYNKPNIPLQQQHLPPPPLKQTMRKPKPTLIIKPVPQEAFEIFRLIRSYANNRHSYRLFINDLETPEVGMSRQTQRMHNIYHMILGQRLLLDNTRDALDRKEGILVDLTEAYDTMNEYYENSFLLQDEILVGKIQDILKPMSLTQIEKIHDPIMIHTIKSLDKRRLGRNYKSSTRNDITDILFQRPVRLKTTCEIRHNTNHPTRNETPPIIENIQYISPENNGKKSPILLMDTNEVSLIDLDDDETVTPDTSTQNSDAASSGCINNAIFMDISSTITPTNTQHNTPTKPHSSTSSTSSIFSPSKWTHENTTNVPQQEASPQQRRSPQAPTDTTVSAPTLNMTHSSPRLHTISTEDEDTRDSTISQARSSTDSTENKIQPIQSAIINLKHYTTNLHEIKMPTSSPLPCSNPFRFQCKDDFALSLNQHLNLHTSNIEDVILISIACNGNTPIDSLNTHIILQPTPPSQFFTNASKINTFFTCLRDLNKPYILELIFTQNPPANILWHHLYRHTKQRFPIIISTTPELIPKIHVSHRAINTARCRYDVTDTSSHDVSLLLLYNTIRDPHFLAINPHFLSKVNPGMSGT